MDGVHGKRRQARERERKTERSTLAVHSRVQLKFWSGHKYKLESVFVMIRGLLN